MKPRRIKWRKGKNKKGDIEKDEDHELGFARVDRGMNL